MKTALTGQGYIPVPVPGSGVGIVDAGGYYSGSDLEAILAEIGAGTAPGSFLTVIGGGKGTVQALGNLGATETIDLANGNYFWGTLDANCTIGFTGWTNLKDCWIVVELIEDGTGGWTPTFSGITWEGNGGAVPVHPTTAGTFTRYLFHSRDGGTTIVGNQAGGSGVTIKDEGSTLATTASSLDFVGAGVVASGTGAAKTVTIPGTPVGAAGGDLSGTYPNPSISAAGLSAVGAHTHVVGEQMTGDGATVAFYLANEATDDQPPAAYVNGSRTDVTLGGMNDTITFGTAPAAAALIRVDYAPATV